MAIQRDDAVEGREVQVLKSPECFQRVRVTLQEMERDPEVYMGGHTVFTALAADSYQEDCMKLIRGTWRHVQNLGDSTRGG
jgi:hypothetical protein